jgi:UDP-N-acetylglucosamine 4-epimerase
VSTIGLRYFNVFGARQDPQGAYAAVIPRWYAAMLAEKPCVIYGDGETSRDFSYVSTVVQANLRAALVEDPQALNQVYNVAVGDRTSLSELHAAIAESLLRLDPSLQVAPPHFADFREGDIRHSLADVSKARRLLNYAPTHNLRAGLAETVKWYARAEPRGQPRTGRRPQD